MRDVNFERFIAIDWSGAKREFQSGIQVAELINGGSRPQLVKPPTGGKWSRQSVLEFISTPNEFPTLIGLDFAFSVPWNGQRLSLPECLSKFSKVDELWSFVDGFCNDAPFLYGGPIWCATDSPLRPFILCIGHKGSQFCSNRLRATESAANPRPETVYKIVGAKTVGAGSFAGMRLLHALRRLNKGIAIWPFDEIRGARVVVAEIYPSAFYVMAGRRRPNLKNDAPDVVAEKVRAVLNHFGVVGRCQPKECRSTDLMLLYLRRRLLTYPRDRVHFLFLIP